MRPSEPPKNARLLHGAFCVEKPLAAVSRNPLRILCAVNPLRHLSPYSCLTFMLDSPCSVPYPV
jgi:hypothetical protein